MIISLDTETTGPDFWHGCKPFLISTCDTEGTLKWWEWHVNPSNREPIIPPGEIAEVQDYVDAAERIVMHNATFDMRALEVIGIEIDHLWDKVDDTLKKSHICDSLESHGLKELSLKYLDVLDDDQKYLQKVVTSARRIGKKHGWDICQKNHPTFPAYNANKLWPMDMWLPRAVYEAGYAPEAPSADQDDAEHTWESACLTYALRDAERTIAIDHMYNQWLDERNLWDVYEESRRLIRVVYNMESNGVTVHMNLLRQRKAHCEEMIRRHSAKCAEIVGASEINFASYPEMCRVLFEDLKLTPVKFGKSGPSTDAQSLDEMMLSAKGPALRFLKNLKAMREFTAALRYIDGYEKAGFAKTAKVDNKFRRYLRLHPSFNQTGTSTTRFSSSNPNAQNISKKVKPCLWCEGEGQIGQEELLRQYPSLNKTD